MSAAVQHEVDRLAAELGRSVVINDPAVVVLYSSRHYGDEDDVRVQAMLNRVAGNAAIGHVLDQGVARWTGPGRIPAKPEIGMRARHCVPLRWHGDLLGLLIIIDADDGLSVAERRLVDAASREIAALMVGEREPIASIAADDDALVADLVGDDAVRRERALAALRSRGAVPPHTALYVVALRAWTPAPAPAPDDPPDHHPVRGSDLRPDPTHVEAALRHATARADRFSGARLATASGATAAVVRFAGPGTDPRQSAQDMVAAADELAVGRFRCAAGIGPHVATVEEAWVSHRQAELAARAVPRLTAGPVVDATDLGAFATLLRIPADALDPTAVPAPLRALLLADPRRRLVATLDAYLRHAGSAPAAAAALHVHRTTLHYRLDRIREITGCDLDDGEVRLLLHLGLKVARLRGEDFLSCEQSGGPTSAPDA